MVETCDTCGRFRVCDRKWNMMGVFMGWADCNNWIPEVNNTRLSKKDYYLGIARQVATRSTCLRRQYGAIIVKDDRIISTGYNGSARGEENCSDVGRCWREENDIPHGQQYEKCKSVHAEANAIINGNPTDMIGATLYLAGFENDIPLHEAKPCEMCERMIKNAQIKEVVMRGDDW